jgi:heme exporter protein A
MLSIGNSLAITGRNGSGKSTLIKMLAGVLTPSKGTIRFEINGHQVKREQLHNEIGLVSPYLQLYDEFTAIENLRYLFRMRGGEPFDQARAEDLLNRVDLLNRKDDQVRTFSSGMKQRLKYAFALLHRPVFLFLDEPTSNLDTMGVEAVLGILEEHRKSGILVIATNDEHEATWCSQRVNLNEAGRR